MAKSRKRNSTKTGPPLEPALQAYIEKLGDAIRVLADRTGRKDLAVVLEDSVRAWLWVTEVLARGNKVVEFNPYRQEGGEVLGQLVLPKIGKKRRT